MLQVKTADGNPVSLPITAGPVSISQEPVTNNLNIVVSNPADRSQITYVVINPAGGANVGPINP